MGIPTGHEIKCNNSKIENETKMTPKLPPPPSPFARYAMNKSQAFQYIIIIFFSGVRPSLDLIQPTETIFVDKGKKAREFLLSFLE